MAACPETRKLEPLFLFAQTETTQHQQSGRVPSDAASGRRQAEGTACACVARLWPSASCEAEGCEAPYRIGHQCREAALEVLHIASSRLIRVHARLRHDLPMFPVRLNAYAMRMPASFFSCTALSRLCAQLDPSESKIRERVWEAPR